MGVGRCVRLGGLEKMSAFLLFFFGWEIQVTSDVKLAFVNMGSILGL